MKRTIIVVLAVIVVVGIVVLITGKSEMAQGKKVLVEEEQVAPHKKVKTKTTYSKEGTTVKRTAEAPGVIEKQTITGKSDGEIRSKDVTNFEKGVPTKEGYLIKDVVKFHHFDKDGTYVYVTKGKREYRLRFREDAKENMLKVKQGEPLHIWSTYPLDTAQINRINTIERCEQIKEDTASDSN